MRRRTQWIFLGLAAASLRADGPADNIAEKVRPVPPPGRAIADPKPSSGLMLVYRGSSSRNLSCCQTRRPWTRLAYGGVAEVLRHLPFRPEV